MQSSSNRLGWVLALAVLAGAALGLWWWLRPSGPPRGGPGGPTAALRFSDVLPGSGITFTHHYVPGEPGERFQINPYDHGSGLAVADVNGDGLDDVYFVDFLGFNHLYLNRGDFKFEDVTEKSGTKMGRNVCVGAAFGDCDNDGDQDLYVTAYRGGNRFFRNRGDGTFEDATKAAGLEYTGHSSSVTWFDCDGDGDLDLFVCNLGKFTADAVSSEADYLYKGLNLVPAIITMSRNPDRKNYGEGCILYRNNGNGTFTDGTKDAGLDDARGWNGDAAVGDYDGDGDPDLFITNMFGSDGLYRNDGKGRFENVTPTALRVTGWGSVGARFFDANGDGKLDLFVVDMHSDMWADPDAKEEVRATTKFDTPWGSRLLTAPIAASLLTRPSKEIVYGNTYFENQGDGTFKEKSTEAGLETWWPWSIAAGDFDNDGHCDLFVASGMGYPFFYWPNALLLNDGKGVFRDVAAEAGIEPPPGGIVVPGLKVKGIPFAKSSRAAAAVDFDGDGDLDLVVANFNHQPYLLRNDLAARPYLKVRLTGKTANRDAIGARVRVVTDKRTLTQELANSGGYLTQTSRTLNFGLGDAESIQRVEVLWPWSTQAQVVEGVKPNTLVAVEQK